MVPVIGISLGALIGLVTGIVAVFLMRAALRIPRGDIGRLVTLAGELLAIPTFWFGGPWLATRLLRHLDFALVLPWYLVTLALAFALIVALPLFRVVTGVASMPIDEEQSTQHVVTIEEDVRE